MKTLGLFAALVLLGNSWVTASADNQMYTVKASGDEPIIFFTRLHHRVADVDDHQELSVFADGKVRVHNPVYMKNAGTHEYVLTSKEMQALLAKLDEQGLMAFDTTNLAATRAQAASVRNASNDQRFHVSDLTATHINLSFGNYAKGSEKGTALNKSIVWNDIPSDARRFKNIRELQGLANAEQTLLELTNLKRRSSVRVAGGK